MLWFVGLGISNSKSIPLEAVEVLKNADIVYLEQFTSPIRESELTIIKNMSQAEFKEGKRWLVEDGNEILKNSKNSNVVLLSYGDPYIATTHIELRVRAIQEKIETKTIHASSSITSMIGECGLQYYKVGKVATIMSDMKSLTTPYYVIYKNLIEGSHSVLLLEFNQDKDFFFDPKDALSGLLETEKEQKRNVIKSTTFAIVASRIGMSEQKIISGDISNLAKHDFGKPPHTIIIPGRLHFTESDALKVLSECVDEPKDNSENTQKISIQMMKKYVPMVQEALEEIKPHYKGEKEFLRTQNYTSKMLKNFSKTAKTK